MSARTAATCDGGDDVQVQVGKRNGGDEKEDEGRDMASFGETGVRDIAGGCGNGSGRARALIAVAASMKRRNDLAKVMMIDDGERQEQARIPLATLIN